jgi:hypothetical protein
LSIQLNQSERLRAMNTDTEALEILRELRPLVAEHIDAAISAAFAQLMRFPEVQKAYAGVDMEEAKRAQRQHWLDDVFATTFSGAQLVHTVEMAVS